MFSPLCTRDGMVQGCSRDTQQLALIRYSGWRIQILSVFPNITDIEATNTRYEPFPWFNTLFLSVIALALVVLAITVKRRRRPRFKVPTN